jgi:hypothetical protein
MVDWPSPAQRAVKGVPTVMLADIWSNPEASEALFLIAFILFMIEFLIRLAKPANWAYPDLFVIAGLACVSLAWLAF